MFKELKTYNEREEFYKDKERVGFLSDSYILKDCLELDSIWILEVYKQLNTDKDRYYYVFILEDESEWVYECTISKQ